MALPFHRHRWRRTRSRALRVTRAGFRGLFAVGTLGDVEGPSRLPLQALETAHRDGGKMYEQVFASIIRRDETETLGIVEPLHGTSCHIVGSFKVACYTERFANAVIVGADGDQNLETPSGSGSKPASRPVFTHSARQRQQGFRGLSIAKAGMKAPGSTPSGAISRLAWDPAHNAAQGADSRRCRPNHTFPPGFQGTRKYACCTLLRLH